VTSDGCPSFFSGTQSARDLAAIISIAGPALITIALLPRRRTETTWPKVLVALALIGTATLCVDAAISAIDQYRNLQDFSVTTMAGTFRDQPFVVVATLQPVRLLTMGALAWSTLSAVRAEEEPRRFWLSVFIGSAVLLGLNILSIAEGLALRIPLNSPGHSALNSPRQSTVLAHPSEAAPAADAKRQLIP
jgi:hypothetical protein